NCGLFGYVKYTSRLISPIKIPREFLLNPGQNPVTSQDPFGKSKQPTLNIPSGSQAHVGDEKRVDGGRRKRPLENVTWSGLSEGNTGLTLHKVILMLKYKCFHNLICLFHELDMAPKGKSSNLRSQLKIVSDELYASSPLVHKENVTGCHHPYASNPRTGHASSSREKIVDDEDENMSPTQSARNDEPRRDNFTVHEQGTQSNSEFTHPPMPLAQSMLSQS
ncbi:hypothetical protein O181_099540, partial [Austropuccinia psidii MF-1]|nr:hypothetical protein [Austropuccinia psidii MF-1]